MTIKGEITKRHPWVGEIKTNTVNENMNLPGLDGTRLHTYQYIVCIMFNIPLIYHVFQIKIKIAR